MGLNTALSVKPRHENCLFFDSRLAVGMMAPNRRMEVTCAKELFMKISKQARLIVGILLLAVGVALLLRYHWSEPSHEINRARLNELMEKKLILSASLAPLPYSGVYSLEGTWKTDGKPAKFSITTH